MKAVAENKFWDFEKEVGKPVQNSTAKSAIKTKITEKDGRVYVDLRKYVHAKGKETGFGQHTGSGVSIEVSTLDAIIAALQNAKAEISKPKAQPKAKTPVARAKAPAKKAGR